MAAAQAVSVRALRGLALVYGLILIAAFGFTSLRLMSPTAIQSDVQDMLPSNGIDPIVRAAILKAGLATSNRVIFSIAAPQPGAAAEAAEKLAALLKQGGLFVEDREDGEATARWLFANRNELACETGERRFGQAEGRAVAQESEAALYNPAAPVTAALLRQDPFFLTMRLGACLAPRPGNDGSDGVILSGRLTRSAFRTDVQKQVITAFEAWKVAMAPKGVTVARGGGVFHAADGARTAERDMSLVGLVSAIGIVLLLVGVFRRVAAIPYALLVVFAGATGSLAASFALFGSIHVLTLVFGFAFVGITSDYAIYYLATGPLTGWAPLARRRGLIFRSVTLCMSTSLLGFGCLAGFRIGVFSQMAVFAVAGLISAWGCAFLLLPPIERMPAPGKAGRLIAWWGRLEGWSLGIRPRWLTIPLLAGSAILIAMAIVYHPTTDDVRTFSRPSADLVRDEAVIRARTGIDMSPDFLMSWGADGHAARRREASLIGRLPPADAATLTALSRFDPPPERRADNARRVHDYLIRPFLAARLALLGVAADPQAAGAPVQLPHWLADLEGQQAGRSFVIAPIPQAIEAAVRAAAARTPDTIFVAPAEIYTRAFADLRRGAATAVVVAIGLLGAALLLIYRTPRALVILVAPILGGACGLAASLALDIPLSFFSIMGLFVIFGTGVDYSILHWEAARAGQNGANLPVLVTAISGILALGMLALSHSYPVRAFGIVVAVGLFVAYYFSAGTLSMLRGQDEHHAH